MAGCILFPRTIGPVAIDVIISERITSELEIAEHPVESGAKISDHAWRKPYLIHLEGINGEESAIAAYNALLALQESVEPFSVLTGFRLFNNMLIESLEPERDTIFGRVLNFRATLREVIIVGTATGPGNGNGTAERGQVQARALDTGSAQGGRAQAILDAHR